MNPNKSKNYTYLAYHYEVNGDVECLFDLFPLCNSEKDLKLQQWVKEMEEKADKWSKESGGLW